MGFFRAFIVLSKKDVVVFAYRKSAKYLNMFDDFPLKMLINIYFKNWELLTSSKEV